uniref:Fibronectin type-III domain-containing protein n=1 Tax=Cyprinus carpio carpio TaxID=630221 RepID=A0A9J7X4Y4_CYPCA
MTMRSNLTIFKNLTESKTCEQAKFIVASKEIKNNPGSCILLYENGSDEATCFTPPSESACPVIERISGHSVVLKVSPACPATEELRLLYKMKEEKDWKSQSVLQSHDTVTLTDLSPDTEYEMKYAAVGKLKYTIHSDVIHLRVIDKKLIDAKDSVLETLSLIENKCSELMNHNSAVTFSAILRKIQDMMKYCQTYEQDLHNRIKSMIQSIQACEKDISALTDLLQAHEESPFNKSDLTEWLTVKEKELKAVDVFLQQLRDSGAEVNNSLDSFLLEISIKNLVCYTFSSLDLPDDLLSDQEHFLNPQMMKRNSEKKPNRGSQTWLTGSIRETMKKHLKIFKELILSNGDQTTVFLVTSKDHTIHPGSCILLYENGSDEASCFTPPSEQACPVIEQISGHSVVLKVPPACPATEELRLLYKMKEEKDWKSQSVLQSHDTVTLTDLSPDTEYEMKYAAVGKLNYTVHSDVIHLRVIDKKLIDAKESVLETLSLIENKCSELMNHNSAVTFSAILRKIQDMMKYCQTYKQDLHNRIKSMIQSIQACEKDISALTDLLQAHEESPFNKSDLTEWLTVKEKELKEVDVILQQLRDSGAEVNNNLDSFLLDTSIKNLVCYTFSSLDLPDDLLSDQENFLNPQMMKRNSEKKPNAGSQTWLTGSIRETMKKHLKIFTELILSNGDQTTVFLVTSKEHTIHPGSCILLYENGSDEASCFTPPSEPACPVIEQISGHSVVLKVSPACPGTEELRLLYKMKEEKDWKSQSVLQSHDTVTLTDLSPDTEYEMKYAAMGKLKYTIHSDVIHLRVIDKKLIDAKDSVLETLSLIENKCSELMENNSAVTFSAIHRKIQDMMKYCQTYKQDLHNRIKSMIQSIQACEKDISALTDLLQAHEESPFNKSDLTEWLTVKEKELKEVDVILQQLRDSGAEVNNNLDSFLLDTSIKNLVCYTFSSLDLPDDLLSDQEHFLNPQMMKRNSEKKPNAGSQTWLTGSIRETMKKHLKIFKELILSNGDQTTVFLIASKEHTIHPGSCILLYENGSDEASCFTPPSEPACPVIEQISGHSVVLKVSPACPATEELRLLYKMKEEKDWKSQSVLQSHDTVTLTDLSPDTEYEMKYAAMGKLNYTVHSDVIRVTTHTTNIREESTRSKIFNKGVNIFSILTGKTANSHKHIISTLQYRIEDMREVGTVDESDIILVFCPVVSRAGTDIDQALDIFNHNTGSKLAVLVVLHHTFDKEKMVPDSSRCVNRTDILTVDCLFYEDTGLLKCQKNSDAVDKVVNWLRQQGRQTGVKIRLHQNFTNPGQNGDQERERLAKVNKRQQMANNEPSTRKVKVFSILAGKIKNCHKEFFDILRNRIENLEEARTVDKSDIILVFCSIVSRAGTDIDAALKNYVYPTDKLAVLVVLHHTFDPEKTVPDSRRCVNRTDILTVDCLFCEDTGLLKCQKNSDAYDKTVYWLIQQGAKIGITISPCQNKSSSFTDVFSSFLPLRGRWE